jgi:hypothetical protein
MIFCWLEFSTGYYQAKRSGLFENETPRSGLQYFKNSAFDSVIKELKSKPTRSEIKTDTGFCSLDVQQDNVIAFGKKFGPPLHRKATIRISSPNHKRTEIIICKL